jgi:diadenosine hexaphosphate hydrolase (ATP-forming)
MAKHPRRVVQGGAIVVRRRGGTRRVLLVRSSDGRSWLFPKGHVEEGETRRQAAARETREEAGVTGRPVRFVGCNRFERDRRIVEVSYYLLNYLGEVGADEYRAKRWCTPAEARRTLSFPGLVRLLDRALNPPRLPRHLWVVLRVSRPLKD